MYYLINRSLMLAHIADIAKKLTQWRDLFPYLGLKEYEKEEIDSSR